MANVFPIDSLNARLRMHECGNGNYWFYHKDSFPGDPPLYYQTLINDAASYVEIWDPYFNIKHPNNDQHIFNSVANGLTIKILTMKGLSSPGNYLVDVENALKTVILPHKNVRFGFRVINKGDPFNQAGRFFHDRFLIIDQLNVYLVGSSVSWHISSQSSTGIYKISDY